MFVPAWSIKVTPKSCDGLSRSVKQEPRLDRCAAITYAVLCEASAQLFESNFLAVLAYRGHDVESYGEGAPAVFE